MTTSKKQVLKLIDGNLHSEQSVYYMPLTTNQHTFPKASINRFGTKKGEEFWVQVYRKNGENGAKLFHSGNGVFCASHLWDQRSENGYMKKIEDDFQLLAHDIISKKISAISPLEKTIVNDFYSLWNIRTHIKKTLGRKGLPDQQFDFQVSVNLTKKNQDSVEENHITPIRPDSNVSGRHFAAVLIREDLYRDRERLANEEWGIIEAEIGEFLVPDNSYHETFIPLSPTLCLLSKRQNAIISQEEVAQVNRFVFDTSIDYFFARDFSKCPIYVPENSSIVTVEQLIKSK
jgi:hypothetical protein